MAPELSYFPPIFSAGFRSFLYLRFLGLRPILLWILVCWYLKFRRYSNFDFALISFRSYITEKIYTIYLLTVNEWKVFEGNKEVEQGAPRVILPYSPIRRLARPELFILPSSVYLSPDYGVNYHAKYNIVANPRLKRIRDVAGMINPDDTFENLVSLTFFKNISDNDIFCWRKRFEVSFQIDLSTNKPKNQHEHAKCGAKPP